MLRCDVELGARMLVGELVQIVVEQVVTHGVRDEQIDAQLQHLFLAGEIGLAEQGGLLRRGRHEVLVERVNEVRVEAAPAEACLHILSINSMPP